MCARVFARVYVVVCARVFARVCVVVCARMCMGVYGWVHMGVCSYGTYVCVCLCVCMHKTKAYV